MVDIQVVNRILIIARVLNWYVALCSPEYYIKFE